MKNSLKIFIGAFAAVILIAGGVVKAEDTAAPTQESHDQHHPEGEAKEKAKGNDMMGSMNMGDMKGMMHECMKMHKDGKMCDHQAMKKCQENMGKGDCQKMMKEAKAKSKKKD